MQNTRMAAVGAALIAAAGGGALVATAATRHDAAPSPSSAPRSAQVAPPPAAADSRLATAAARETTDAKSVYEGAKASVAEIQAQTPEGTSTGTGFVVDAGGTLVTNAHVVGEADQVSVRLGTDGATLPAQVLGTAPDQDLAVLHVDPAGTQLSPLKLAGSPVAVGDTVYALGSPFGLSQTFTSGIVSALGRDIQAPDGATISGAIQTDAAINPGNSGGPLLNADGDVVGVNSQIASQGGGNDGIGFAIPADTVRSVLEQASAGASAMGVTVAPSQTPDAVASGAGA